MTMTGKLVDLSSCASNKWPDDETMPDELARQTLESSSIGSEILYRDM